MDIEAALPDCYKEDEVKMKMDSDDDFGLHISSYAGGQGLNENVPENKEETKMSDLRKALEEEGAEQEALEKLKKALKTNKEGDALLADFAKKAVAFHLNDDEEAATELAQLALDSGFAQDDLKAALKTALHKATQEEAAPDDVVEEEREEMGEEIVADKPYEEMDPLERIAAEFNPKKLSELQEKRSGGPSALLKKYIKKRAARRP